MGKPLLDEFIYVFRGKHSLSLYSRPALNALKPILFAILSISYVRFNEECLSRKVMLFSPLRPERKELLVEAAWPTSLYFSFWNQMWHQLSSSEIPVQERIELECFFKTI